jgi:hypothetical protein
MALQVAEVMEEFKLSSSGLSPEETYDDTDDIPTLGITAQTSARFASSASIASEASSY